MAENDTLKPKRRRRQSKEVSDELSMLIAERDRLDASKVKRDQIEQDALRRYAEAQVQLRKVDDAAARKVEKLQRQIAEVEQKAGEVRAASERDQAEALAMLNAEPVGRTAEELSQLLGLPIKRTRRMIREGKSTTSSATSAPSSPVEDSLLSVNEEVPESPTAEGIAALSEIREPSGSGL